MKRTIAIVMPVYNQERYLRRALDSVASQTRQSGFTVICVNDGSTDSSAAILDEYAGRNPWMRIVTKVNGGLSSARNAGLDRALEMPDVGWFTTFDPDDLMHPQWVEIVGKAAEDHPEEILGWGYQSEDEEGFLRRRYAVDGLMTERCGGGRNVWSHLFPLSVVRDVRFFEGASIAEDMAFHLTVGHRHRVAYRRIPAVLNFYTIDPESLSHRKLTLRGIMERRAIVEYMIGVLEDDPAALRRFCRTKLPGELKRYWRQLKDAVPAESAAARRLFAEELASLRRRGLLHPHAGSIKDLKYHFRFLWEIVRLRMRGGVE